MNSSVNTGGARRGHLSLIVAVLGRLVYPPRAAAEDRADYKYEDYAEGGGRIHIRTHGVYFEKALSTWLAVKGNYIYDGISGATPLGAPPIPGETEVTKVTIEDIRRAGFIEPVFKIESHTLSPQLAFSRESDYESIGVALTHAWEVNEKNTTLSWGLSHAFDRVLPNPGAAIDEPRRKDTTDLLLGVSQLLGPKTVLTVNLTLGYSEGYLADPYKRVLFDDFPYTPGMPYTVFPERRPGHKFRQVGYVAVNQFVEPLRGAAEASYRLHHDDGGIWAHTISVEWHQKLPGRVTVSPLFRYHTQTAANFYGPRFPGDPSLVGETDPSLPPMVLPDHYSADYRLSALDSFTYGVNLSVRLHEHGSLNFGYRRYEMQGRDGVTAQDQYPAAHIFTGGVTVWF